MYRYGFEVISGPRMMVWQEDHYVETRLNLNEYNIQELKLYRADLIEDFKKIEPDCSTPFFDIKGEALLWYGRNGKGDLEYFTALAKHPETGKSLKEITLYMIKKHICNSY